MNRNAPDSTHVHAGIAAALHLTVAKPGRAVVVLPGSVFGDGATMNKSEFQTYHEREAARLRRLIANATTLAVRARLMEQAQEHERLAEGVEEDADAMADAE